VPIESWFGPHFKFVYATTGARHIKLTKRKKFNTKAEAIDSLISDLKEDDSDLDDSESSEYKLIRQHLEAGKAYWKWKWQRKGNGNFYKCMENMSKDYLLNVDCDEAQDIDEIKLQVARAATATAEKQVGCAAATAIARLSLAPPKA
jgi:hypothetical protein